MNDDQLEAIELASRAPPPDRRGVSIVAIAFAVVVALAGGAIALVTSEHHTQRKTAPAPTPPPTTPAFSATMLGFTSGRFAVVDAGRLEIVDARARTTTPATAPDGQMAIAATNGASLIVVARRHWFLVEPDRAPVPVPAGNVFARRAGGWWLAQGRGITVLGGIGAAVQAPTGTTPIADSGNGFVVQEGATGHVAIWDPGRLNAPVRTVVPARADVVAVGGDELAWRPFSHDRAPIRILDMRTGRSSTLAHTDLTSAADASFAPDGKHLVFYARPSGTVAVFDTASSALLVIFNARPLGVFSSVTSLPGPTTLQPLPFTWTPDGRKIVVLGSPYPLPRVTSLDTNDGIAITTPVSIALDQLAVLDTPTTS